jgi:hypothetical protein
MSEETTEGLGSGLTETPVQTESNVTESAPSVDFGSEDMYRQFVETLPEDVRGAKALQETKDFTSLANQMLNAQSALGKKRLESPQEDWGDDQWEEFYGNLRPENDEYSVPEEIQLPEGFDGVEAPNFDDDTVQELVDFAGELGLTQRQFDQLYSRYGQMYAEGNQNVIQQQAGTLKEFKTALQAEWKDDFDVNMKSSTEAFNTLSQEIPELNELISDPIVANHPATMKLFHKLSQTMGDTLPPSGSNVPSAFGSGSVQGIRAQIQDLDASNSELILSNPSSLPMADRSKRQQILDKRAQLYAQLYGEG